MPVRGQATRNLNLAVDLRGGHGEEISPAQAREVLTLTCKWLHVMHESGMVHGEVAFHDIAYSADTDTSICVLDFEASRRIGMPSFRGPDRSETHWLDPQADAREASQDSDRYQLALLAFRLLVTRTRNGLIDADAVPQALDGFTEHETSLLSGLWDWRVAHGEPAHHARVATRPRGQRFVSTSDCRRGTSSVLSQRRLR